MKILLLGINGQLGFELSRTCPPDIQLISCDTPRIDYLSSQSIQDCITHASPDWIINAAAYTAVDKAESDQKTAFRLNYDAVLEIAQMAIKQNSRLVHISTDYIFNGENHRPWQVDDTPDPQSVYGLSKYRGENAVSQLMGDKAVIIRTAWLYSAHGSNFVKTMLNLMRTGKDLKVIDEQVGTPTWANGLAQLIWTAIIKDLAGIFHWTDAGVASWYDFAVAIQEEAVGQGLLETPVSITPVSSDQFPTEAKRPFYSVLDKQETWVKTDVTPVHWRVQLRSMLKELNNE